jgi:uncharacterized protein YdgA (DUF945 family)
MLKRALSAQTNGSSSMKKPVTIAVVVAIVIVLMGLPFLTGMLTESHVRQRLTAMGDNPVLIAELETYDRGWLASTARINLGLSPQYLAQLEAGAPSPDTDFLSQRLPVLVEFAHGPLASGNGLHLGLSTVVARSDPDSPLIAALREALGVPYLFELRGRSGFGGGFEFDADVPPFDYSDGSNEVKFSGLLVDGSLVDDRLLVQSAIESLDYANAFATALLERVRVTADYALRANNIALGNADFRIERVVVASALLGTEPIFAASGLQFYSDVGLDESAAVMRIALNYGAESVAAGASLTLTETNLGMTLADLDAAAMQEYYTILQPGGPAADPDEMLATLTPVLWRLLEGGPSLTVDPIAFSMNGEPFSANILVETDPAALPGGRRDLLDPALWLAVASVNAEADVSKALAQRIAEQFMRGQLAAAGAAGGEAIPEDELAAMAEAQAGFLLVTLSGQGFLEDNGESYTASLRFAAGELTVNGTIVPLPLP